MPDVIGEAFILSVTVHGQNVTLFENEMCMTRCRLSFRSFSGDGVKYPDQSNQTYFGLCFNGIVNNGVGGHG